MRIPAIMPSGLVVALSLVLAPSIAAQESAEAAPAARAAAYQELAALPDWSGVWYPDWSALFGPNGRKTPLLTSSAQAEYDAFIAAQAQGRNVQSMDANCVPPGMPRIMQMPYPIEFLYSPGRVTIITETYSQVRRIYTDGREPEADPDPFFNGNSVGHWDGDTLVATTNGFHPMTTLAEGVGHSDQMVIDERIYLENPDRIIVEMTITDPVTLSEPFVIRQPYDRKPGWQMREYVCQENNRDGSDQEGRAMMDLGLEEFDGFGALDEE